MVWGCVFVLRIYGGFAASPHQSIALRIEAINDSSDIICAIW